MLAWTARARAGSAGVSPAPGWERRRLAGSGLGAPASVVVQKIHAERRYAPADFDELPAAPDAGGPSDDPSPSAPSPRPSGDGGGEPGRRRLDRGPLVEPLRKNRVASAALAELVRGGLQGITLTLLDRVERKLLRASTAMKLELLGGLKRPRWAVLKG